MKTYIVTIFNGRFHFNYMEFATSSKEAKDIAREKIKNKPESIIISARKSS